MCGVLLSSAGCLPDLADDPGDKSAVPPDEDEATFTPGDPGSVTPNPHNTSGPVSAATAVDVLFMIDNSGSMSEEQKKISAILDEIVQSLGQGRKARGDDPGFPGAESLHIAVVSSDMGVNGAPSQKSCGSLSFLPDERSPTTANTFLNKPKGDDGIFQTSTTVAVQGIWGSLTPGGEPAELVAGDPSCANVAFPDGQRFIDLAAGDDALVAAQAFRCVAKLGKNGCGLEQPLESVLKALTSPDSSLRFTSNSKGQGEAWGAHTVSGPNAGFLRDEAVLVVVFLTDEEDCSVPDSSNAMFDAMSTVIAGEINVRCGMPENQHFLHSVRERYVAGLKALKPARYQDRIVVASIVGVPMAGTSGSAVHSGSDAIELLLARPDMQFGVRRNAAMTADEPVASCVSASGDGSAAPARRYLELAEAFGDNGLVTSICEDQYGAIAEAVIGRVGAQLRAGDEAVK
jgi:hypothetical protein